VSGNDECRVHARAIVPCPPAIWWPTGGLIFARDLQLKGESGRPPAGSPRASNRTRAELCLRMVYAWRNPRTSSARRDAAIAAFNRARDADPDDRHGASLRLMLLGAEKLAVMPPAYVRALFDQYARKFDERAGRRSRLSRAGAVVQSVC